MTDERPWIMVVDDDAGIRVTLEGMIEEEGYEVTGVEDGYRAIELAKEAPFALIFMDIKMPGINGVETYREIKKVSPQSVVSTSSDYVRVMDQRLCQWLLCQANSYPVR